MGTKDTRPAVMADSSSPSGPALALASSPPASPGCHLAGYELVWNSVAFGQMGTS
jgi:hypothetical protein